MGLSKYLRRLMTMSTKQMYQVSMVLVLLSMCCFPLSLIDIGDNLRLNYFEEKRDDTDQPINIKDGVNQQALLNDPLKVKSYQSLYLIQDA
jgi:hypothetical protein